MFTKILCSQKISPVGQGCDQKLNRVQDRQDPGKQRKNLEQVGNQNEIKTDARNQTRPGADDWTRAEPAQLGFIDRRILNIKDGSGH